MNTQTYGVDKLQRKENDFTRFNKMCVHGNGLGGGITASTVFWQSQPRYTRITFC